MNNEELKKIREDKGLKKGEFATLLRVTPMIYGRYESGTLAIPEKVENAVRELAGDKGSDKIVVDAAVADTAVAAVPDTVVATEIEVKKKTRAAGRKTKVAAEDIVDSIKKNTAIMIQSQLGGMITPEEVLQRIPEGCDAVYIKPEENKAYWVKGLESGCVNLW